jgi:hypothetical protein
MGNRPLPRVLLRLEGLTVLVAALALYFDRGYAWWVLLVLALAPDVSIVGYLASVRVGAVTYDALHTRTSSACSRPRTG